MAQKPEQLERGPCRTKGGRRSGRRYIKRSTARYRRRWAKRDPEGASQRPFYKGYEL